jgi:hypothetical protein
MTTWSKRGLFGLLFLVSVVLGLTPSVILNVWPYATHGQGSMAVVQFILALGAAITAIGMGYTSTGWQVVSAVLLGLLIFVCLGNGIESSALIRGEVSAEHDMKTEEKGDWTARIVELSAEKEKIVKDPRFTRTGKDLLEAAQEGKETASNLRDFACRPGNSTSGCAKATDDLRASQEKLEQVSWNYNMTARVDQLEETIHRTREKVDHLGAPTVDYLKQARIEAQVFPFNPLENRSAFIPLACELWAAIGPKLMVSWVIALFVSMFGPKWWENDVPPPPSVRESFAQKQPSRESLPKTNARDFIAIAAVPTKTTPAVMAAAVHGEGVRAWLEAVKPIPGGTNEWRKAGQVFPEYVAFCQARGYPPCKAPTVLGTIIRHHCAPRPSKKLGGSTFYEFNLGPRLTLVTDQSFATANAS